MAEFAVIMPAAGSSTRFGGRGSKLLETVAGKTVLAHSLGAFSRRGDVKHIIVAAPQAIRAQVARTPGVIFCDGGTCRAESVWCGLREVAAGIEWVAVHDAARPMVSQGLIDRTLAAAVAHGAAAPALAVVQTIRQAEEALPSRSGGVIPRSRLWAMQTPQLMRRADLLDAFERCPIPLDQVTDDVQLLELAGREVWLVPGEESNLKITTPTDLLLAEALWAGGGKKSG
jgi:2-C-methyl-D-erythritol 4-phosphate cytidylyltransferase